MNPVSPATLLSPQASIRTALLAGGAAPDFALALTAMLLPGGPKLPAADGEIEAGAERQVIAATGKNLPETLTQLEEKAEDEPGAEDLPFAWFAIPAPLPQVAEPLGIQLPRPSTIRLPEGEAGSVPELRLPGAALAETGFGTVPAETAEAVATPDAPAFELPELLPVQTRTAAKIEAQPESSEAPIRIELPRRASAPQVQPLAQLAARAAAEPVQPLAAPLVALQAAAELPGQPRRTAPRDAAITAPAPANAEPVRPHIVAPTPDAQQPVLDTRRHEWMASMIDHIEALRDSPGSRETSIRLTPDALGTIDVSIRHEGDRVHVRINAETPAARALLAEAQPRLAELAEARGLRLGQTNIEGGAAGQGGQPRHEAPRAQPNPAPLSASATEIETQSDERIA